ncbi:DUF1997 domain-containing protein [Cyanobium sp. CH-040]|uniref:DUF1997 domain-containing protein n=1 Tax=Cyanobium sp. CH-040 TaxID=2823708 RepID=UPI0020CDB0BC|nr:DUF1997 domain-containing protein [Cyanobium sp. CH-040]MCP9928577.1 DUF1997 domain-containing protein [Cyanobium sp. CH-040]
MPLAFSASQQLELPVREQADRLASYLGEEERVVRALLNPNQLQTLAPRHYRYTVTRLQVFQLQIQPVVELRTRSSPGRLELEAIDCQLEGLGLVDDFQLSLHSWMVAGDQGLEGEATLSVEVSQPPLLKLIPARVLESTGRSLLAGILLGIKSRVGQQVVEDFQHWCRQG